MAASTKAKSKLSKIVDDLGSLDVVTFSGNLVVDLKAITTEDNGTINFQDVMKNIKAKVDKGESSFTAIAATHIALDKDTVQFVKEGLTEDEERLYHLHLEAVETAVAARAAMVSSLMRIAGLNG
jgi:hypothetical protein